MILRYDVQKREGAAITDENFVVEAFTVEDDRLFEWRGGKLFSSWGQAACMT